MTWEQWPPSGPIRVEGGLKARSTRGAIAQTWWSQRFVEVLEALGIGGRISRGRTYARRGQVVRLEVRPGAVEAVVQGSRPSPYEVWVELDAFTDDEWTRVEQSLAEQAFFRAKLLAGEMPREIEDVFTACGLSLFPTRQYEMTMDCSCPDWAVPCKHLAAVFYLLAEAFDVDPFLVLAWRGRTKDALLANLSELTGAGLDDVDDGEQADALPDDRPLSELVDRFWVGEPFELPVSARPISPDLVLREVEPPPIEVRGQSLAEVLRPAYTAMTTDS